MASTPKIESNFEPKIIYNRNFHTNSKVFSRISKPAVPFFGRGLPHVSERKSEAPLPSYHAVSLLDLHCSVQAPAVTLINAPMRASSNTNTDYSLSPAVRAVCEQKDAAVDLVMATVNAFLDASPLCSLVLAALAGHAHLVRRLSARHPRSFDACCEEAMDSAAEFGHLAVVQWLHEHRSEGCTTDAMDMAACNGHLDVVQWLHANRREGCTTNAMDFAAQNGHLHVLQWLHEHRREGCTRSAMDNAATSGHLHVMQWLHIHRHEGCSKSALANACFAGHYNVALWLLHFRRGDCRKEDMLTSSFCRQFLFEKWRQQQQQRPHRPQADSGEQSSWDGADMDIAQLVVELSRQSAKKRRLSLTHSENVGLTAAAELQRLSTGVEESVKC